MVRVSGGKYMANKTVGPKAKEGCFQKNIPKKATAATTQAHYWMKIAKAGVIKQIRSNSVNIPALVLYIFGS